MRQQYKITNKRASAGTLEIPRGGNHFIAKGGTLRPFLDEAQARAVRAAHGYGLELIEKPKSKRRTLTGPEMVKKVVPRKAATKPTKPAKPAEKENR